MRLDVQQPLASRRRARFKNGAWLLFGTVCLATNSAAIRPALAPDGTMGVCNDGTYSYSREKRGACRVNGGVKQWYRDRAGAMMPAASGVQTVAPALSNPRITD